MVLQKNYMKITAPLITKKIVRTVDMFWGTVVNTNKVKSEQEF